MTSNQPVANSLADFQRLLEEVANESGAVVAGVSTTPDVAPLESAGYDPQEYPWSVSLWDRYGEPGPEWEHGRFKSAAEAVAAAEQVLDQFLEANFAPGISASRLRLLWSLHGFQPFVSPDPEQGFDAHAYCMRRAEAMWAEANLN